MPPVHIRAATPADIPAIISLEQATAKASHWSLQQYQAAVFDATRHILVIASEGTICGFIVARGNAHEWEIENFAVAEAARRKGLGSQLVRESLDLAYQQGAEEIFLEVRESNRAARTLYERFGFAQSGHRRRYYQNPDEDAIVYRLRCS